jgi:hypothetical protein
MSDGFHTSSLTNLEPDQPCHASRHTLEPEIDRLEPARAEPDRKCVVCRICYRGRPGCHRRLWTDADAHVRKCSIDSNAARTAMDQHCTPDPNQPDRLRRAALDQHHGVMDHRCPDIEPRFKRRPGEPGGWPDRVRHVDPLPERVPPRLEPERFLSTQIDAFLSTTNGVTGSCSRTARTARS